MCGLSPRVAPVPVGCIHVYTWGGVTLPNTPKDKKGITGMRRVCIVETGFNIWFGYDGVIHIVSGNMMWYNIEQTPGHTDSERKNESAGGAGRRKMLSFSLFFFFKDYSSYILLYLLLI